MKTKQRIEKRRALLFIPLILWPFLALAFYALGGGGAKGEGMPVQKLDTSLPDASFKDEVASDKMGLYDRAGARAKKDSLSSLRGMAGQLGFGDQDDKAQLIQQKLDQLQREIDVPASSLSNPAANTWEKSAKTVSPSMKSDIDRLELLMKGMRQPAAEDPELKQLDGLMQGILDIQHPDRVEQRLKERGTSVPDSQFRAIPAVIALGQKVVQGATVKLILRDSAIFGGMLVPAGHPVYGACRITNQRLLLDIRQIRLGTSIVPVDLSVYSLDGMMGIDAPEAMLSDAASSGADNAIRNAGLLAMDQTLATQVAGAGIDAAKGLFSRKLSRVRVRLKAGTPILLRNNQNRISPTKQKDKL